MKFRSREMRVNWRQDLKKDINIRRKNKKMDSKSYEKEENEIRKSELKRNVVYFSQRIR